MGGLAGLASLTGRRVVQTRAPGGGDFVATITAKVLQFIDYFQIACY